MASTLYDYYKSQGQALPSVQQRRQQYGLGNDYVGTAAQNTALLQRLLSGGGGGGAPAAPAAPAQPDYLAQAQSIYQPVFNPTSYNMDYFTQQAQKLYDPVYKPIEDRTNEQYNQANQKLAEDLQAEYSRRGILNSGIYGEQLAKSKTSLETERAAALAKVALDRLNMVNSYATNQYNTQQDTNQKYTQQVQDWINTKMEQDMKQRQYEQELILAQQKAKSTGSKKTASKTSKYKYTQDKSGGFQFKDNNNSPITAAQYFSGIGGSFNDLYELFTRSGNAGDREIAAQMQRGVSPEVLAQKYPWVFGGV